MDKKRTFLKNLSLALFFCVILAISSSAGAADVLVIGDIKLKPVAEVVSSLKRSASFSIIVKSPGEVRDNLAGVVTREGAKAVVALGTDAVYISLSLPESVPVIYGLVINPPETKRKNITGIYMATPVEKYLAVIEKYFPRIEKVGLIYERAGQRPVSAAPLSSHLEVQYAGNPYEFLESIKRLDKSIDALLLVPEKNLITSSSLQRAYIFSFTEKVPLIGISEKHVKEGSLMSVVFDIDDMGRQLGDLIHRVMMHGTAMGSPQFPPEKYKVYFNKQTAESMGIRVEPELLKVAERVYP